MKEVKFIREFTPNWFAVTMGTGGTALVLDHYTPWLPFLHWIGTVLWIINILLFVIFSAFFIIRFICYPHHFLLMLKHSIQPLFLGCIPMGLVTIINGFINFGSSLLSSELAFCVAQTLWWIDVLLALGFSWLVCFSMFLLQDHSPETMTPVWLLPLVSCEVVASSGGSLIAHFPEWIRYFAFFISLGLWAISVLLALGVLTLFFNRLVMHSLPDKAFAPSIWLVLGPIGTGALGLMTLAAASQSLPIFSSLNFLHTMIEVFPGIALFGAILLWGFGFWWLITAIISSIYLYKKSIDFGLSWWAFTFPLAVYTLGTFAIEKQTDSILFTVCGVICSILLFCSWLVVSLRTLQGACNQTLFSAPCLSALKKNEFPQEKN